MKDTHEAVAQETIRVGDIVEFISEGGFLWTEPDSFDTAYGVVMGERPLGYAVNVCGAPESFEPDNQYIFYHTEVERMVTDYNLVRDAIRETFEYGFEISEYRGLEPSDLQTYRTFIDEVYDGDSKSFKEDVESTLTRICNERDVYYALDGGTYITLPGGNTVTYARVLNEIKKEVFG